MCGLPKKKENIEHTAEKFIEMPRYYKGNEELFYSRDIYDYVHQKIKDPYISINLRVNFYLLMRMFP